MLTLYTTPVIYLAFDRAGASGHWSRRARSRVPAMHDPGIGRRSLHEHFRRPSSTGRSATTLLTVALAGRAHRLSAFCRSSPLPQVDFPTISVSAALPGASPETMASSVATPLERQFGRIAGVNEMTSSSSLGSTSITMQFDLNRNIDAAARDVQAAINAARGQLPANLPSNPNWRKVNPADAPILMLALTSDDHDPGRMYDAASTILQQKLSQVQRRRAGVRRRRRAAGACAWT